MARVADPLRDYADVMEHMTADNFDSIQGPKYLRGLADQIDEEHKRRMHQCEYEVRRRLCKDVRWAVNKLEKCCVRGWIGQQIENGETCDE